jgi:hypothetical protein
MQLHPTKVLPEPQLYEFSRLSVQLCSGERSTRALGGTPSGFGRQMARLFLQF